MMSIVKGILLGKTTRLLDSSDKKVILFKVFRCSYLFLEIIEGVFQCSLIIEGHFICRPVFKVSLTTGKTDGKLFLRVGHYFIINNTRNYL